MSHTQRNIVITAVILLAIILLCWGTIVLSTNIADQFLNRKMPVPTATADAYPGLFILDVLPGSPGARAGLQAGQIILQADGTTTNTPVELQGILTTKQSGDAINLVLLVDGERRQTELFRGLEPPYLGIEIIENGPNVTLPVATSSPDAEEPVAETAVPPTPDVSHLGLAVISAVLPNTPAAEARLAAGDVITAVDGNAILTGSELVNIINNKAAGDIIVLTFRRGPDTFTRTITLAPHPENDIRGFLGIELQTN